MPAHVGHQRAELAVGQLEEVVVVAAGPVRRPAVRGHVQPRHHRHRRRQQALLEFADGPQFVVRLVVLLPQLVAQHQRLGGPREQVAQPDQFRHLLAGERRRVLPGDQQHARGGAHVEQRDGQQRPLTGQESLGRIAGRQVQVVDDAGLVVVHQVRDQPAGVDRQLLRLPPRVHRLRPQVVPGDAVPRRVESAAAHGQLPGGRVELVQPAGEHPRQLLGVRVARQLPHQFDADGEPPPRVAGGRVEKVGGDPHDPASAGVMCGRGRRGDRRGGLHENRSPEK